MVIKYLEVHSVKRFLTLLFLIIFSITIAGCTRPGSNTNNQNGNDTEEANIKAVNTLTEEFGKKLQMVSLLAGKDQVSKSMDDNYSQYITAALLEKWKNAPELAPGRMVSSPWPDRIEISKTEKISDGTYKVTGSIIEVTSVESSSGGAAAKRPVILIVQKVQDKWKITDVTLGDYEGSDSTLYKNNQYGFNFQLPQSWKGYTVITTKWEGLEIGSVKVLEAGPIINLRHPLWTKDKPRQDIPIMVFTINQWNELQQDKFHIGAAPIGPKELGRNSKYVFALPARYNFSFLTGFEEVEDILNSNALKATEEFAK